MNKGIASAILLVVSAILAQGERPLTHFDRGLNAEHEVGRLNAAEVKAFLDSDPATLDKLWSEDFVVTNPLNKFVSKKQVLGMMESGFLVILFMDRRIDYVRAYGRTVVMAGSETVRWGGKMPNAGKTEHLRFTSIWMKRAGRWQEIARHANIVPLI